VYVCLPVTGGTDGLRQVGSAFLQLKLVLDKGGVAETVFMGAPTGSHCTRHAPCGARTAG
jgi:hypothetical protein